MLGLNKEETDYAGERPMPTDLCAATHRRDTSNNASRLRGALFASAALGISAYFAASPAYTAVPIDGSNPACDDLRVQVDLWIG